MTMRLFLAHHGDAVAANVDPQRPLSPTGLDGVARTAAEAARRGIKPAVVWHSGELRARQTAEAFLSACNPAAHLAAMPDMQPSDSPEFVRDRLRGEARDVLIAGHFPHFPRLLAMLLAASSDTVPFPPHGVVALATDDEGETWREEWRIE